jgi:putative flavoprotein involved in K+ transport
MAEYVETVIVGGGQAGLAMSYHLSQLGREHIVLERGRVAERWRSERWDSLMFQFPNWNIALPGYAYEGDEPDGFMPRAGVVRFIEAYARRIAAPLRCGIRVTALRQSVGMGRLSVETDHFTLEAANVVLATGPYHEPLVPTFSVALPASTYQLTANRYTNPGELPTGGVLVVGSGASGYQIAEDLVSSGRDVHLSVGRHRRVPRRYRGKDFMWWQEAKGVWDQTSDSIPPGRPALLLTGVNGGQEADLRRLAQNGVTLLGSLQAIDGDQLCFAPDLEENLTKGDEGIDEFKRSVDKYIAEHNLAMPAESRATSIPPRITPSFEKLDIQTAGITSVIWATGYRYDFKWVHCPVLDASGTPIHQRGVTSVPGLYFLGLKYLHKFKSSFLGGVGEDAAYLAEHIAMRT